MQPRKTELARTALQAHRAPLDMRQRRLLILCDGQRTLADLTGLIGQDAAAMVIQLVQAGYLSTGTAATAAPPPPAAAAAPATGSERRRSLVAARIYVLGILEMQRHPQAVALFRELQQARAESDVLQVLQSAMRTLPGLTSEGYCQRVRQRLLEALPLEHCDAFAEVA
ncbi:hypothetical protein GPNADHDJ_01550 [Stenotrophomonas maltophilia]|jgi:hypothetical protein|uniref:Uncharacterized protein n=1 Tax=Stenotrophomonas maltophilia TaxID=40324 RepID=A0AAX1IE86_STEMA|nr:MULTISPECIES: hypothetical protein [Stenotrophomonas]MPS35774.1 hypothetical protein [Stenotrophomonas sp.]KXU93015.1 hypothetical protein AB839_16780 [Stenotrophomonas sp. DDT-1]MCF3495900.1 hypothetical protein [Stenotrophomonas maltophilia]MDQ4682640.1 hypothetical protein [Stenotrophomonas maltophilia group sp. RNC7]QGL82165.1 hypothetical protein FEO94_20015 [Stenotrophomonas maltophilia]